MPRTTRPLCPPVDAGLTCRNCAEPIYAIAQIHGSGTSISVLREYLWIHGHGDAVCRPTMAAQPFDGQRATSAVEAVLAARQAAEKALTDALED